MFALFYSFSVLIYFHILFIFSEIGVLTANKISTRQYKIVAPLNPEKPIKYVRKPIDYSILDDIGHGLHAKQKQRISSQVCLFINFALFFFTNVFGLRNKKN